MVSHLEVKAYCQCSLLLCLGRAEAVAQSSGTQARSQGGFEGVWTNPPCSLAKFIFNTEVHGTIIQPCSGIVTDGLQAIMQWLQGVVTYTSPVEAFATGSRILIGENRP